MRRIFWDSMLFIYLLEEHPIYFEQVRDLLARSYARGDTLLTSYLVLGEVLAGSEKSGLMKERAVRNRLDEMGFDYIPFDARAIKPFSSLRANSKVKVADSINLACAPAGSTDLFLTNDTQLQKLHVPGIKFIASFELAVV